MIKRLITLSNILDARGLAKEADYLDGLIRLAADEEDDNVITLPFAAAKEPVDEEVVPAIFSDEGVFIDYDEALTELASTVTLFADMPMSQRDWENFGKETLLEQISGFDNSVSMQPLRDASLDSPDDFSEVMDEQGNYKDYAYAVEATLRLLTEVSKFDQIPNNLSEVMKDHQRKISPLAQRVYEGDSGEYPVQPTSYEVIPFPPIKGKPDMDSLDHMSIELSEED